MVIATFNSADTSGTTHATVSGEAAGKAGATLKALETGVGGTP
jgi:hypothetical protein